MLAAIRAIEYHLPRRALTNEELSAQFTDWTPQRIEAKTGIETRRVAEECECASDLAVVAAQRLFSTGACRPADVDFVLLCTQCPDYLLPTTACIIQDRLDIPTSAGALDINLGCSGFVYALGLAKGLIETGQSKNVLLLTADTYTKYLDPNDRSVRSLFGDGAAATLVSALDADGAGQAPLLGPFVYGTDGQGAPNLILPAGGTRLPCLVASGAAIPGVAEPNAGHQARYLYMNGPEVFDFAIRVVPHCVEHLLAQAGKTLGEVDLFVFHQANRYMLDHLRRKLGIAEDRFVVAMRHCGNTVSSSIPIALSEARSCGMLREGDLVMLVGFGVGYSWAAALVRWTG